MSNKATDNAYAKVIGVDMFFRPENTGTVKNKIEKFFSSHSLSIKDIDLVINELRRRNKSASNGNRLTKEIIVI